jgi:hypothetical protein
VSHKICPNCNAEVPAVANLCKHCFHDFHTVVAKRSSPLWPLLFLALGSGIVSVMAFSDMHGNSRTSRVAIDGETDRIVFTEVYSDGPKSTQIFFKDVESVEYKMDGSPRPFEVAILTTSGERLVMSQGDEPLEYKARQMAEMLDRPMTSVGGADLSDLKKK